MSRGEGYKWITTWHDKAEVLEKTEQWEMGLDHGGPHPSFWRVCTLSNEVLGSHQERKYSGGKMEDRFQIQRPRVKPRLLLQFLYYKYRSLIIIWKVGAVLKPWHWSIMETTKKQRTVGKGSTCIKGDDKITRDQFGCMAAGIRLIITSLQLILFY